MTACTETCPTFFAELDEHVHVCAGEDDGHTGHRCSCGTEWWMHTTQIRRPARAVTAPAIAKIFGVPDRTIGIPTSWWRHQWQRLWRRP